MFSWVPYLAAPLHLQDVLKNASADSQLLNIDVGEIV